MTKSRTGTWDSETWDSRTWDSMTWDSGTWHSGKWKEPHVTRRLADQEGVNELSEKLLITRSILVDQGVNEL